MARLADTADAIVIGAGPNGLVAANLLADAGWDVLVLEQELSPGGAVRSGELAAAGYLTELGSAFYPFGVASPVLRRLNLPDYGLRWRHAPSDLAHLLPDGRAAVLSRDLAATAESVAQFAATDAQRWQSAYRDWRVVGPQVLAALFTPFPPVRPVGRLLRQLGPGRALRLARRLLLPARRLGDELFDGEGARALLAGCTLHADLTLEEPGGGVYGWLLAMLAQQHGFPVPVGGAQQVTAALTRRLRSRGGKLYCGVRVERVAVAAGQARGVCSAGGEWWRARRAVLADVSAPALYRDLVGLSRLPPRFADDLAGFRWDSATLKVDWALAGPVPWRNPEVAGAAVVHLGGDVDGMSRYAAALARDELPFEPFLVLGQLTTADPQRSPPGTEALWCYTHLPRRLDLPEAIERHVARVETLLETYAPGFRSLIRGRFVAGPAKLAEQNPNLVNGAIGGGTAGLQQQLVFRPVPGLGRGDTPIDRLYLASSAAHPGGGVHGGPGANAARAALARHRRLTGPLYGAAMAAAHRHLYAD